MMPVEVNQWRATIGCFRVSMQSPLCKNTRLLTIFFQVFKLYLFCFRFIATSIFLLPFVVIIHFIAINSVATLLCFLPLFARVHRLAKIVIYTAVELLKRIPLGVIILVRYKYHSQYAFFCTACTACFTLHIQWLVFRTILLSGDVEPNPGPETLDFAVGI